MGRDVTILSLQNGALAVELAPSAGGSIARFSIDGRDVLRRMATVDRQSGKGDHASAYPLVPFSNRIANGRLDFEGETFHLARNWPGVNHPMHGDGWCHAWRVVRADDQGAEISYEHAAAGATGGWPFRYRARQTYTLESDRLTVTIALDNLEDRAVPAGIGLHPFFVREADTELQTLTQWMWRTDADVLPVERIATPPQADFARARNVNEVNLDNGFDGWTRHATVRWPQARLRLDLEASPTFAHAVIYVPPNRPYFCVEAVSHANGQVGRTHLDAGATLSGEIVFRLSSEA
jgi:aldose 1-epimerase